MIRRNRLAIGTLDPDSRKGTRDLRPRAPLASQLLQQIDMFPQGSIEWNASQRSLQVVRNRFQPSSQVGIHGVLPRQVESKRSTTIRSKCHDLNQNVTLTPVHLWMAPIWQEHLLTSWRYGHLSDLIQSGFLVRVNYGTSRYWQDTSEPQGAGVCVRCPDRNGPNQSMNTASASL